MEKTIKNCIYRNDGNAIINLLNSGLDPNYEGGWPVRLAARHGSYLVVKSLLQKGANPHLLGESGASTLQLAVYSGAHWTSDKWTFLLSCCDSSQLADGAAVAIVFNNVPALTRILETGRCNTNIPTTLTGKTVEDLAKGYKLQYLLNVPVPENQRNSNEMSSPNTHRYSRSETRNTRVDRVGNELAVSPRAQHRNLSPSVARFFCQTAGQSGLTPPRNTIVMGSPTFSS